MNTTTTTTKTRTQADTLRVIADLFDAHPDLPPGYVSAHTSGSTSVTWGVSYGIDADDQKAAAAAIIKTIGGKWDKDFDWGENDRADFMQVRDGIELRIVVERSAVCDRIVTGTETVTLPAVEAKPERVEEREVVEWRCEPLLAGAAS